MTESPLVDAAEGLLPVLRGMGDPTPEEVLATWEDFYTHHFPELYARQVEDYAEQGADWRAVALARVFPALRQRLPAMEDARERIVRLWGEVMARARRVTGLEGEVQAVVHVGIGCGAGWATTYGGKPAVLLGLESIAELGWQAERRLEGLIAHELGHVAHSTWRGEPLEELESDPFGLLYVEGFAQRLEHRILDRESWHLALDEGWLPWCCAHLPEIARAYRDRAARGEPVHAFFGSWSSFQRVPFTGHFLGHAAVRVLAEGQTLPELARLPLADVRASVDRFLRALAAGA
ncbi:MAG TPA: hypothetical protein ENN53_05950 [Candidatus Acetothermia bacterium]|nr:hypothetical protein [Candidatus Acetothermia bacterium]